MNQIVNFALHPIHTSNQYLKVCKERLKHNSVLQLDNFLSSESLKNIQNEAIYLHSKAFYCSQDHTVLLAKKNNEIDIKWINKISIKLENYFYSKINFYKNLLNIIKEYEESIKLI